MKTHTQFGSNVITLCSVAVDTCSKKQKYGLIFERVQCVCQQPESIITIREWFWGIFVSIFIMFDTIKVVGKKSVLQHNIMMLLCNE